MKTSEENNSKQFQESEMIKRRKSFCKRWNIVEDSNIDLNKIKIRCLNVIAKMLDDANKPSDFDFYFNNNDDFLEDYCSEISMILGFDHDSSSVGRFEYTDLHKNILNLELNYIHDYETFIWFLEETLNYNFNNNNLNKYDLVSKINDALILSNARVKILLNNNYYELYPTNIEFLDNYLIFDNLNWLNKYPKAKEHFSKAIKLENIKDNYRTIVDELRLSLEFLLKDIFNNKKSLENQISEVGIYLNDNNISKEINNMFVKLLNLYTLYNNNNAKHNDTVISLEINYMIYLTGTFISLIVQTEHNKLIII